MGAYTPLSPWQVRDYRAGLGSHTSQRYFHTKCALRIRLGRPSLWVLVPVPLGAHTPRSSCNGRYADWDVPTEQRLTELRANVLTLHQVTILKCLPPMHMHPPPLTTRHACARLPCTCTRLS